MSFIEALDLRYIVFASQNTDGMESTGDDDTLSEIVVKARSIFDTTLKAMWREYETLSSPRGTTGHEGGFKQHREEMINLDDEYNKHHPKTPKNLRMSPMRTSSFNYRNHGFISQSESIDSACSEGSNGSMFRPFKRPRRWFFPQNKSESLAAPLFSSTSAKIVPETHNSSTMKPVLPKFHFNFGKKQQFRQHRRKEKLNAVWRPQQGTNGCTIVTARWNVFLRISWTWKRLSIYVRASNEPDS